MATIRPNVTNFKYNGVALTAVEPGTAFGGTDLQKTTWILDKICQTKSKHVERFLHEFKDKNMVRLLNIKRKPEVAERDDEGIVTQVTRRDVPWNIGTSAHALAILLALFGTEAENVEECDTCKAFNSGGPWDTCLVTTVAGQKNACVNCVYSGKSPTCSCRKDAKRANRVEQAKANKKILIEDAADIKDVGEVELEEWLNMVDKGIAKKEEIRNVKKKEEDEKRRQARERSETTQSFDGEDILELD